MSEALRKYELLYIMPGNVAADEVEGVDQICSQSIEKFGGELLFKDDWGVRTLAYPVKKNVEGHYVLLRLACSPDCLDEIERRFKITESVIKYLSVRLPDDYVQAEIEAVVSADEEEIESDEAQDEAEEASDDEEQTEDGQGE